MGNTKSGEVRQWVDAQALHTEDPRSFWAPTMEQLAAIKKGDFVKIVARSSSERFWCEVQQVSGNGHLICIIRPEFSTLSGGKESQGSSLKVEIEKSHVCDIKKRNRRRSMLAINHDAYRTEAMKVVFETELGAGSDPNGSKAKEDTRSGIDKGKGVLSTIEYSMAEALYKKGSISKAEFTEALQGGNMEKAFASSGAHRSGNGVDEPDSSATGEAYARRVLCDVVALFIRFEGRSPSQSELSDLSLEVKETLREGGLSDSSDQSIDKVMKELSVSSTDPFENRLNKWLLLETEELKLARKSRFGINIFSTIDTIEEEGEQKERESSSAPAAQQSVKIEVDDQEASS